MTPWTHSHCCMYIACRSNEIWILTLGFQNALQFLDILILNEVVLEQLEIFSNLGTIRNVRTLGCPWHEICKCSAAEVSLQCCRGEPAGNAALLSSNYRLQPATCCSRLLFVRFFHITHATHESDAYEEALKKQQLASVTCKLVSNFLKNSQGFLNFLKMFK